MSGLTLTVDIGSLRRYSNGTISGIVYVQTGEIAFPERNWNDLVVMVVGEWLHSVSQLALGASWEERFHFLDGPFAINLVLENTGVVKASLIDRRPLHEVVCGETQTDLKELFQNACSAADRLLSECARRGWTNPNLEDLASARQEITGQKPVSRKN